MASRNILSFIALLLSAMVACAENFETIDTASGSAGFCAFGDVTVAPVYRNNLTLDIGSETWPLSAFVSGREFTDPKYIIINLGGGPNADAKKGLHKISAFFGPSQSTVYAIEYSGSYSQNRVVRRRLEDHGFEALDCDILYIQRFMHFLKEEHPGATFIIKGESFSGLMAMKLASLVDPDKLILIAPWTHFLTFDEIKRVGVSSFMNGKLVNFDDPKFRKSHIERNLVLLRIDEQSPSDPGREWMFNARSTYDFDPDKTLIIHAEHENRTNLKESISYFSSYCNMHVVDKVIHEGLSAHPKTKSLVSDFLNNSSHECE